MHEREIKGWLEGELWLGGGGGASKNNLKLIQAEYQAIWSYHQSSVHHMLARNGYFRFSSFDSALSPKGG